MQFSKFFILLLFFAFLLGCEKEDSKPNTGEELPNGIVNFSSGSSGGSSSGGASGGQGQNPEPGTEGLITAGEWSDLQNWDYWLELNNDQEHEEAIAMWGFPEIERYSVIVENNAGLPVRDARVNLLLAGNKVYAARTNNLGRAELYASPSTQLRLEVEGRSNRNRVIPFAEGENRITVNGLVPSQRVEIAFIVDATSSMSDELKFLQADLSSVIRIVEQQLSAIDIATAAVFYRDKGDDYITRHSDFSNEIGRTRNFVEQQNADGGGDFPEAVAEALDVTVSTLSWSDDARARIAFLLLDAPPHSDESTLDSYRTSIKRAAEMGIRIIPITASGIDRPTEFLMRLTAIATNGTYVFITDDSGIGDDHLEPTVGDYEVEYLKELMIRLIGEFAG